MLADRVWVEEWPYGLVIIIIPVRNTQFCDLYSLNTKDISLKRGEVHKRSILRRLFFLTEVGPWNDDIQEEFAARNIFEVSIYKTTSELDKPVSELETMDKLILSFISARKRDAKLWYSKVSIYIPYQRSLILILQRLRK